MSIHGLMVVNRSTGRRDGQRGLTLIELMISLLISSMLIGLVFSIYSRMAVAYRGQVAVSELQQTLRAAKEIMIREIRSAGHLIPNGFRYKDLGGQQDGPPVVVQNDPYGFGPDVIQVFYAETSAMARIATADLSTPSISVDDVDGFAIGNLAVIVRQKSFEPNNAGDPAAMATLVHYHACLVQITNIAGNTFNIVSAPTNSADVGHCTFDSSTIIASGSMLYRFVGRAFRIDDDIASRSIGVLQMSPTGALGGLDDWQDLGMGFTDLQVAARTYEEGDLVDNPDGIAGPTRDWYSGAVAPPAPQDPPGTPTIVEITEVTISLANRTLKDINVVPSKSTPGFIDPLNPNHNPIGDSPSILLEGVPDAARPAEHRGSHIYRSLSVRVDLRNIGVGR